MYSRIFNRLLVALRGSWKLIALALVISLAGFVYIQRATLLGEFTSTLPCDDAFIQVLQGQPGDDQHVVDCLSPLPTGPKSTDEVALARSQQASKQLHTTKVGRFSSAGIRVNGQGTGATGIVYAILDGYPESIITVYLNADGKVIGIA